MLVNSISYQMLRVWYNVYPIGLDNCVHYTTYLSFYCGIVLWILKVMVIEYRRKKNIYYLIKCLKRGKNKGREAGSKPFLIHYPYLKVFRRLQKPARLWFISVYLGAELFMNLQCNEMRLCVVEWYSDKYSIVLFSSL